jgi:hypothetical protein
VRGKVREKERERESERYCGRLKSLKYSDCERQGSQVGKMNDGERKRDTIKSQKSLQSNY